MQRLHLKPADQHRYLNGGCTRFFSRQSQSSMKVSDSKRSSADQTKFGSLQDQVVDDLLDFQRLQQTLGLFGLDEEKQKQLFGIVAAVLHVGDIEFEEQAEGSCTISAASATNLNYAAELLQVDSDSIRSALLSRVVQTARGGGGGRGTVYLLPRRLFECRQSRDALAKALYARLFEHVLSHVVNASLPIGQFASNRENGYSIGVLDVAGFECFDRNGFEQLCVNFGNERLQQFFAERVLKDEQRLYKTEGLNVRPVPFDDSSACVALFERSPDGLWAMLDEEARLPRPASAHFNERLLQTHANNPHLAAPRQSTLKSDRQLLPQEAFVVRHFAGAVCYRSENFLQKNSDALAPQLLQLLLDSNCSFVQKLFEADAKLAEKAFQPTAGPNARAPSVSGVFRSQLNDLLQRLRNTGTHFVRCIKPNQEMLPGKFEGAHVLAQLRCSGMHSVLELMQRGFPSRTSFADLYSKYESLLPPVLRRLEPRLFCRMLFRALGLHDDDYRFGTSRVFLRAGKFAEFDQLIKSDPEHVRQLIDRVQKHLHVARWKQAQWAALSVIKCK